METNPAQVRRRPLGQASGRAGWRGIVTGVCLVAIWVGAGCGPKTPPPVTKLVINPSSQPATGNAPAAETPLAPPPDPDARPVTPLEESAPAPAANSADQIEMWKTTLESMVADFTLSHERPPKDLNELVALKLLPGVPEGPRGKKFAIDQKTHQVVLVDR